MKTSIRILTVLTLLCFFFKSGSNTTNDYNLDDHYHSIDNSYQDSLPLDSLITVFGNIFGEEERLAIVNKLSKQSTPPSQGATTIPKEQTNSNALWILFYLTSMCALMLLLKRYYQKKIATIPSRKHTPPPSSIDASVKPIIASTSSIQSISTKDETTTTNKSALIDQIRILRAENQTSQRQLTVNSLEFIKHENLVKTIGKKLPTVIERVKGDARNQLIELSNLVERHQNHRNEWDSFRHFFGQVHPGFTIRLQEQFPSLNNNDIRLISFLRLQLTTGEIASLLKVTPSSIHKARYRLKKKLNLDKEVDLDKFLVNIAK